MINLQHKKKHLNGMPIGNGSKMKNKIKNRNRTLERYKFEFYMKDLSILPKPFISSFILKNKTKIYLLIVNISRYCNFYPKNIKKRN